jgi:hypothetical protein
MHLEKVGTVKNKIIHFKMKKGFGKAYTCLGHGNTRLGHGNTRLNHGNTRLGEKI